MSRWTQLLDGIALGESPRWHGGRLWFSDWGAGEILAVTPGAEPEVVARLPSFPFSMDWLPDGRLLVVSQAEVLRLDASGSLVPYADLGPVSEQAWNEIVVDAAGNTFVDCVGFDLMAGDEPAPGLVAVVTPDGAVRRVADGLEFPNGMAVTPDGTTLVVAESYAGRLTAFDIGADGSLSGRRVWAQLAGAAPDGICLDATGAVWFADVPNRRCVRVREGGEVLDVLETDDGCFACMLGGADGRTLFMVTADWTGLSGTMGGGARTGRLLAAEAPARHAGWP